MKVYKSNKRILSVVNNPTAFLNGLTSNTMSAPANALVNIHGRIIATFNQLSVSDNEMWLLIEEPFLEKAKAHLGRYAPISGVKLETKAHHVYYDLEGSLPLESGDHALTDRGARLVVTSRTLTTSVSEEEFTLFRLQRNLPVQGVDYVDDFILNVSTKELVSFTKGCYLGQEPVAKVYHRSKPTWKLVVRSEDECSEEEKAKMTSKVFYPVSQKKLGFTFIKN